MDELTKASTGVVKCMIGLLTGLIGAVSLVKIYARITRGVCRSQRDLKGKTVIITGATSGIGLETARDIAGRNARVIMAVRNTSKGEEVKSDIVETTGNKDVVVMKLDVSSFQSVVDFVRDLKAREKRLDILINNAGVMVLPSPEKSVDGLNMVMATNHYGPFLLTNMLLPLLTASAPSRIVIVSSLAQEWCKLDLDKLNDDEYNVLDTYAKSALANVLFTVQLAERLKGSGVSVNDANPGDVRTCITRNMDFMTWLTINVIYSPILKNPKQGAQTPIYVAVAEELEGVSGKYFSDCRERKLRSHASDMAIARRLWKHSETVTKLKKRCNNS